MANDELKIGEESKPRFEFRSFGQGFKEAAFRMGRLSVPLPGDPRYYNTALTKQPYKTWSR